VQRQCDTQLVSLLHAAALLQQMHFREFTIIVGAHPHPGGSEVDTVSCVRTNASNRRETHCNNDRYKAILIWEPAFFRFVILYVIAAVQINTRVACEM
jgi:hypothetical protein